MTDPDRWIARPAPRPAAALRLFCLPYAGAGASAFRGWPERLGALTDVEVLAVRPPGREDRLSEPPEVDLNALTAAVGLWADRPYGIYGHSVGARIGFEIAHRLAGLGRPPAVLCVSGCPAPHLPVEHPEDSALDDDAFVARVGGLGGTPAEVLADPEFRELVLPALRADFAFVDSYEYRHPEPLALPVLAVGGDADPEASPAAIRAWRAETTGRFRCATLPGDHFFLHSAAEELHALVAMALAEAADLTSTR